MKKICVSVLFCVWYSVNGMNDEKTNQKPLSVVTTTVFDESIYYDYPPDIHNPYSQYVLISSPKSSNKPIKHESQQYDHIPMYKNESQPATDKNPVEAEPQNSSEEAKNNICTELYNTMCAYGNALLAFFDLSQKK